MQRKKNIRLLILLVILLAWTVLFANLKISESRVAVDEKQFTVMDTTDLKKISIDKQGEAEDIVLEKKDDNWWVNKTYRIDPSMKKVLLAVLHEVRVKRTVPKTMLKEITDELHKNGSKITIEKNNGSEISFLAGGDGISISYFMYPDKQPYIVYLPGYESYVTGIFDVSVNDWRDRLLFRSTWMGIRKFSLKYPKFPSHNIIVEPEGNLYRMENLADLDTAKLMNYFDQISYFYTDQYINKGQIPVYDSLLQTYPYARLAVDAVGMKNPVTIDFYWQLPGEKVKLGLVNGKQMCLFRGKRIDFLFKSRNNFEK